MKNLIALLSLIIVCIFNPVYCFAQQAGSLDTTFNQYLYQHFGDGTGINRNVAINTNSINKTIQQSDGKIIICGWFSSYNGFSRPGIVRVFPDGEIDLSFNPQITAQEIICIAIQTDGKIIIGGSVSGTSFLGLTRLNINGSIDSSFQQGIVNNNYIQTIHIQTDGKILIGGNFQNCSNISRKSIARLNSDGTLDLTFDPGTGFSNNSLVLEIKELIDGKIIVSGSFTTYNGVSTNCICRLNHDGIKDNLFIGNLGGYSADAKFSIDSNNKILVSGRFTSVNGTQKKYIARLNFDGDIDTSFDPGTGPDYYINSHRILPDGKILIAGPFISVNGTTQNNLSSLNNNGSLDTLFDISIGVQGTNHTIQSVDLLQNNQIIIAGTFDSYNNILRSCIATLNMNGSLINSTFHIGVGANNKVNSSKIGYDDRIVIAGDFDYYNGVVRNKIARLNSDGTIDPTFNSILNIDNSITDFDIQFDGKIVIIGDFLTINGNVQNRIARLNSNGSLDLTFQTGLGADDKISDIKILSNGDIIIVGEFNTFNNISRNKIAKLDETGQLDMSFNPGLLIQYQYGGPLIYEYGVEAISSQEDGKILIAGNFVVPSLNLTFIARLNTDGVFDNNFTTATDIGGLESTGIEWFVSSLPNNKILLGGPISINNQPNQYNLVLLNEDGTRDISFSSQLDIYAGVYSMFYQPDGKILLGIKYFVPQGNSHDNLIRLNMNGSIDPSFNLIDSCSIIGSPSQSINNILMQSDGKLIITGEFEKYNNHLTNNITRINNDFIVSDNIELTFFNVKSVECSQTGNATAFAYYGVPPYNYTWQNSSLNSPTETFYSADIYTCTVTDDIGNTKTSSLLINAPESYSNFELNSNLLSTNFRPGFQSNVWIDAFNNGCTPISGQLTLISDPLLDFVNSTPSPSYQSGDTLVWDFSNLTYDSIHITPLIEFSTSPSAIIGDSIKLTTIVTPLIDDSNSTNNLKLFIFPVVNGYDPNIKSVYPLGKCDVGYIKHDQILTYTIQFQNTGNSEAINISVLDSLDLDLNLNTVRIVGKSHDLWTEVLPENVLKFHFNNIQLPDSTSNEPESHGYVIFEVKPVSTWLPHNTEIKNKAEIYFDYNPAITTNSVSNLIYQDDNYESYNCLDAGINKLSDNSIKLFPNPTMGNLTIDFGKEIINGEIIITDIHGIEVLKKIILNNEKTTINIHDLSNGIYFISMDDYSGIALHEKMKIIKVND